ncbi:universal stress protein [Caldisericum exile]|uniref:UspA family protein n=1 Tax=Caldisericum exile (strain DSM 21853 / NBRC 104410 / AZM16c01) TaxID=511051 RepID=A0A7U6GEN9_CALEA|nr:universal stress protein [Caldisericum exile]BAL80998.1 UspA family protein [Caldisericum exile AZM16c01]
MIGKVVFPFDFSKFSEQVIPYISKLKNFGLKEVVVVNVLEYEEFTSRSSSKLEIEEYRKRNFERLKYVKENLEKEGFKVTLRVEFGIPSKVIVTTSEEEKANLIIIASTGAGFTPTLIGSTVQNVIRLSKIPVLVIPSV